MTLNIDATSWTIAEGHTGEYRYQLRMRRLEAQFIKAELPFRMNIFWTMTESDDFGYPTSSELLRLHTFENRLVDAEEGDNFSILSIVLTGRREREFVFYTSDAQEFVSRLSKMPQESDRYPIKIYRNNDPDWEYYNREAESIQKS